MGVDIALAICAMENDAPLKASRIDDDFVQSLLGTHCLDSIFARSFSCTADPILCNDFAGHFDMMSCSIACISCF
jgi:hypothetical protein